MRKFRFFGDNGLPIGVYRFRTVQDAIDFAESNWSREIRICNEDYEEVAVVNDGARLACWDY